MRWKRKQTRTRATLLHCKGVCLVAVDHTLVQHQHALCYANLLVLSFSIQKLDWIQTDVPLTGPTLVPYSKLDLISLPLKG